MSRKKKDKENIIIEDDINDTRNPFHRLNPLVNDLTRYIHRSDTGFVKHCEKVIQDLVGEAQVRSSRIVQGLSNIETSTVSSASTLVELGAPRVVNKDQSLCNNAVSLPIIDKRKKDVRIKSSYEGK